LLDEAAGIGYRSPAVKVSVVIPTLNEAPRITEAIRRAWTAGADEVIVCDGGSLDDTAEVARQQTCHFVETAKGRAVQQNAAARQATGDVLLFLHADTWLDAGAIDQIRGLPARRKFVCGGFEQHIEAPGRVFRWLERGDALRVRLFGLAYGDQGIFVRREVFEAVGRFPEIPLMEDVRLMRKLRRRGRPVLLPGPIHVSPRRWQRYGVVRQTLRNWSLLLAERLGVPPERLAPFYPR
jgi:rSAM/selenodomain-associated transferase 2